MKLNWSNPITWMIAGVVIIIIGVAIGSTSDDNGSGNPVAVVVVIFFLIGAFTWAIRRGLARGQQDR